MVVSGSEIGEVDSPLQLVDQQQKNHPFTALGRQSSIYSLTLDEFQHTLCEGGKDFGSMNMDEFLTSIWNAEENQAINSNNDNCHQNYNCTNKQVSSHAHLALNETSSSSKGIAKQPSLPRQGSLTIPAPLCRKTVDEVWSEIHREQQGQGQSNNNNIGNVQNAENCTRQPTFGEMTLEDFLIKAGVVREQCMPPAAPPPQHHPKFGLYQTSNNPPVGPGLVPSPIMGMGSNDAFGGSAYQTMPPGGVIGDSSGYVNDGKKGGGYQPAASQPTAICYNGKVAATGAYGPGQALGVVSPMSPISSVGMHANQVDNGATQFGMDMGGLRGRKRIINGPIEKVVERRQRRMIKNRESAARSRARKQAYTVELEAELNQLKQENAHLKQALAELERKRKQLVNHLTDSKCTASKAPKRNNNLGCFCSDVFLLYNIWHIKSRKSKH